MALPTVQMVLLNRALIWGVNYIHGLLGLRTGINCGLLGTSRLLYKETQGYLFLALDHTTSKTSTAPHNAGQHYSNQAHLVSMSEDIQQKHSQKALECKGSLSILPC